MIGSLVVALLVFLALALFVAIVGYVVRPRRVPPDDPYLTVHGEVPHMPIACANAASGKRVVAARRNAIERLEHSLEPSGETRTADGRMYAGSPSVRTLLRRAL